MLKQVVYQIKTMMAKRTMLFDVESMDVVAEVRGNVISVDGLNGQYTLSEAKDGVASAGSINDTLVFKDGKVTTESFFGEEAKEINIKARKLNVGDAFKRDVALEAIIDTKVGNGIVVYMGGTRAIKAKHKNSVSEDLSMKAYCTIGVMFKVEASKIDVIGWAEYDKLFINSVVGARKQGTSLVEFENIVDRFYAGESYVVDMEFSYEDEMFMNEHFLDGLKYFGATVGRLEI